MRNGITNVLGRSSENNRKIIGGVTNLVSIIYSTAYSRYLKELMQERADNDPTYNENFDSFSRADMDDAHKYASAMSTRYQEGNLAFATERLTHASTGLNLAGRKIHRLAGMGTSSATEMDVMIPTSIGAGGMPIATIALEGAANSIAYGSTDPATRAVMDHSKAIFDGHTARNGDQAKLSGIINKAQSEAVKTNLFRMLFNKLYTGMQNGFLEDMVNYIIEDAVEALKTSDNGQ